MLIFSIGIFGAGWMVEKSGGGGTNPEEGGGGAPPKEGLGLPKVDWLLVPPKFGAAGLPKGLFSFCFSIFVNFYVIYYSISITI